MLETAENSYPEEEVEGTQHCRETKYYGHVFMRRHY
jgi:hypothetical protein